MARYLECIRVSLHMEQTGLSTSLGPRGWSGRAAGRNGPGQPGAGRLLVSHDQRFVLEPVHRPVTEKNSAQGAPLRVPSPLLRSLSLVGVGTYAPFPHLHLRLGPRQLCSEAHHFLWALCRIFENADLKVKHPRLIEP